MDFNGFVLGVDFLRTEAWDDTVYPFNLPAVAGIDGLDFHDQVTFLVGENGAGKSTLIEAIAIAAKLNAEGGGIQHNFSSYDTHSSLHSYTRLVRSHRRETDRYFLRAETFYSQSRYLHSSGSAMRRYGDKHLQQQSHGEGMMSVFWHRFQQDGFYILDEPEAALSPQRQMSFLTRLHDLVQEGCQFVIATHSPIILSYPNALIYEISEAGVLPTDWRNLAHVDTMQQFLKHPDSFHRILLDDK
jgi:predicted ATPase